MPKVHDTGSAAPARGRTRRVASTLAEINVVPLVDVMLVLLIIFMVTAPMIQRGLDVNLPVATRAAQIEGERIFVTVPADYRSTRRVQLNQEEIPVEVLQERVRQSLERLSDKEVYLRGDGSVQYQDLVEVFSRLQAAGVAKVGLVTRLPGER
jgi:biopolymer transport protein TolR